MSACPMTLRGDSEVESATAWLAARLRPPSDMVVSSWIPGDFEAYARILHPVEVREGSPPLRWADVACWSGLALTPSSSWPEIALAETARASEVPWTGQGPREGSLERVDALALVRVLSPLTPGHCFFGVWEGYGGGVTVRATDAGDAPRRVGGPALVTLPWRNYELFEGPVTGASCFETQSFQSPNLWWPADRSWCVASEIDLPWSYVAGTRRVINAVLGDEVLESQEVTAHDSIRVGLPTWLAEPLRVATEEILSVGETNIELAMGRVSATLERRSRRTSVLATRSQRPHSWSGSSTYVDSRRPEEMRAQIAFALERAVVHLASS